MSAAIASLIVLVSPVTTATFNYFQWVFMDVTKDGTIFAYDDATNLTASVGNLTLRAAVEPEHTYHVLLLADNKPPSSVTDPNPNPTLLASAYTKFTANASSSQFSLTLIPVVVDVKFSGGSDGARQPGRLAKTVGMDKEQTYTLEYFIGSSNKGVMATDDTLKQAANDGMWPLKLASAEVRQNDTWLYKYSEKNTQTGVQETLKAYQAGVLDTVEVPLNNAFGTNLAWVQWGTDSIQGLNDLSVNKSLSTTGRGKYGLDTSRTALTTGTVWFHLEYVSFAIFNDAMWSTASAGKLTTRPVWVIRNGLNDKPQDASTWTSGMAYDSTNGNGGIAVGVVDPAAAAEQYGIFEDNNSWPIEGTSGKTSVDLLSWVTTYCNGQSIGDKTLAGMRNAGWSKFGVYHAVLPRRYYATTGGNNTNDATSWLKAQNVVNFAETNIKLTTLPVEIWVAAGTYGSGGTVINIGANSAIGAVDGLKIYGGFKGTETAPIGSLPTDRASWFNNYATLAIGNEYGTLKDPVRKTILDANNSGVVVKVVKVANFVLDGFTVTGGTQSGLYIYNAEETALFTNLEVTGNKINASPTWATFGWGGGGIRVDGGAPRLDKLTVTNNQAEDTQNWFGGLIGGGICLHLDDVSRLGTSALVTNILVCDNVAAKSGGGIACNESNPRLENIVVTANQAEQNGGGIHMDVANNTGNPLVIVNALVVGNTTEGNVTGEPPTDFGGGGIFAQIGNFTIVNALIVGNRMNISGKPGKVDDYITLSQLGGGGIKVHKNGHLTLINSTVSGNYAHRTFTVNTSLQGHPNDPNSLIGWGGGIIIDGENDNKEPSSLKLYNSIVLGNTGRSGMDDDITISPYGNRNTYTAFNSLVGGFSKADLETGINGTPGTVYGTTAGNGFPGSGRDPDPADYASIKGIPEYGNILPGANDVDGMNYGSAVDHTAVLHRVLRASHSTQHGP
jgi:predicted outer membrane repeat protein